ncbi:MULTISPECIES: DUF2268 domain-containing putative Zn-dependent protease [unclassified Pseudomonas]|uniref:DUF2268 domain-containing putative Zn-dependent protease n=1 Tax=unclassified Pseudomonas TaxID=196821 RepID=UPI0025FAB3FE|nr:MULTISPECIES: DUF2268 domain-containing putative Zn-dependent protease [unclassified Pseudomonas]
MAALNLHLLDARGTLTDINQWLRTALSRTHQIAGSLMALSPLDVVVKAGTHVIPEKGHLGYAAEAGVIYLTVDPASPVLRDNADASLERMFAHELHHAARWQGPGYEKTLGESLVSEGLAGHFALQVCGGSPEPWEQLGACEIQPYIATAQTQWSRSDHDHAAWFFGSAGLPKWLGYSLGFRLVGRFLSEHPGSRASDLAQLDAEAFRSALG